MRFNTNLLAGLLLTGVLALAPANSFARGGVGEVATVEGFIGGFGTSGIGGVVHGFHGPIAQGGRGVEDVKRARGSEFSLPPAVMVEGIECCLNVLRDRDTPVR